MIFAQIGHYNMVYRQPFHIRTQLLDFWDADKVLSCFFTFTAVTDGVSSMVRFNLDRLMRRYAVFFEECRF